RVAELVFHRLLEVLSRLRGRAVDRRHGAPGAIAAEDHLIFDDGRSYRHVFERREEPEAGALPQLLSRKIHLDQVAKEAGEEGILEHDRAVAERLADHSAREATRSAELDRRPRCVRTLPHGEARA